MFKLAYRKYEVVGPSEGQSKRTNNMVSGALFILRTNRQKEETLRVIISTRNQLGKDVQLGRLLQQPPSIHCLEVGSEFSKTSSGPADPHTVPYVE